MDANISPRVRWALDDTLAVLRPHSMLPSVCAAIEKLNAGSKETSNAGLDEALSGLADLRVRLRELAGISPRVREHVEDAYRDVSHEYLLRHSKAA